MESHYTRAFRAQSSQTNYGLNSEIKEQFETHSRNIMKPKIASRLRSMNKRRRKHILQLIKKRNDSKKTAGNFLANMEYEARTATM